MDIEETKERTKGRVEEVCDKEENERQRRKTGGEIKKGSRFVKSRNEKGSDGNREEERENTRKRGGLR